MDLRGDGLPGGAETQAQDCKEEIDEWLAPQRLPGPEGKVGNGRGATGGRQEWALMRGRMVHEITGKWAGLTNSSLLTIEYTFNPRIRDAFDLKFSFA
jgi:hypothetical protein